MSWLNAAIAVGSAVYGGYQANKQANAAKKAMKDPRAADRTMYAGQLGDLLKDPSSFYQNPMYQAAFGQGQQAVTRGMAAEGFTGSGNMATGLQKYGQSFGFDMFTNYTKYLAELAGFAHFPDQGAGLSAISDANSQTQNALGQLGGVMGRFGGGSTTMPMPQSINTPYEPSFSAPSYSGPAPSVPSMDFSGPR